MRETKINCDICESEIDENDYPYVDEDDAVSMPVIMTTETNEGRSCEPYLSTEKMDICDDCHAKVLKGNYVFGAGAMGHNKYYFKESDSEKLVEAYRTEIVEGIRKGEIPKGFCQGTIFKKYESENRD